MGKINTILLCTMTNKGIQIHYGFHCKLPKGGSDAKIIRLTTAITASDIPPISKVLCPAVRRCNVVCNLHRQGADDSGGSEPGKAGYGRLDAEGDLLSTATRSLASYS